MALTHKNSLRNSHNKSIHVVQLASGDLWAGAEVMLYTLVKSLHTDLNIKVTVILLNHGKLEEKLRECGIDLYVLDESQLNGFKIFQQLNQIIKDIKPDVLHTHRLKENILGSIVAWRHHTPSIRTKHGAPEHRPPFYKLPKHLILLLDSLTGRYLQKKVIAVSADLAAKIKPTFSAEKVEVIANGIDIKSLTHNQPKRHLNTTGHYHIGIAGRLMPVKRIDLFIESATHLKQHHPELKIDFHIYGDGPLHNELKAQILTQQAGNYIHLEGHCENISDALQKLDALLMTSDHEGLPMILLEAMCLKTPIIAHAVGGIPDLLDEGDCGVLVHEHTAKAFAESVANLISNNEYRQQITQLAFERVNESFSAVTTAEGYLDIYKKVTDISRPASA